MALNNVIDCIVRITWAPQAPRENDTFVVRQHNKAISAFRWKQQRMNVERCARHRWCGSVPTQESHDNASGMLLICNRRLCCVVEQLHSPHFLFNLSIARCSDRHNAQVYTSYFTINRWQDLPHSVEIDFNLLCDTLDIRYFAALSRSITTQCTVYNLWKNRRPHCV